jgi:hypothetical protein
MPDLLKSYVLRNAEQLSPRSADAVGILSHPARLRSERYEQWNRLCEARRYTELIAQTRRFLDGEEPIRSTRQVPAPLQKPLEFAAHHGYQFGREEFLRHYDPKELGRELGRVDQSGQYPADSNFKRIYTNVADQLLAEAVTPGVQPRSSFDKQAVLKTLYLLERAHAEGRGRFELNVKRLYASPVVLPGCLLDLDPCSEVARVNAAGRVEVSAAPVLGRGGEVPKPGCECTCNTDCVRQNPCCARIVPYVADLFVVRDEIRCYEVGEMSYIENVIQSEIRVRRHRHLEREEILTETTEETAFSEEKDHEVAEQFSLHKEVEKSVEQELSLDAGVTVNYHWGTGSVTATSNTGFNLSKKDAQKSVQDYSKKVLEKSVSKLERKVREFASRKMVRETEEINKHVYGGTDGAPADISRQFYYVNGVRRAQVFNYGRRTMLDFYLPEPAELYKRLLDKQFKLKAPERPRLEAEQIDEKNYQELVKTYHLKDVPAPPKFTTKINFTINEQYEQPKRGGTGYHTGQTAFNVPDKYQAVYWHSDNPEIIWSDGGNSIVVSAGGSDIVYISGGTDTPATSLPNLTGNQTVSFASDNVRSMQLDITVECQLLPEYKLEWQLSVYDQVMEAYGKDLAAYEAALAEFEKGKQAKYRQNPFLLLQEMQEQLKQAAISYISCQFFDAMDAMKHSVEPCGYPQPDLTEAQREGEFVRFFEQAFEWKFMNFIFYPYFWGRKCSWPDKFKEEADNMLFQRFLRAGYARVSVSVRVGFEGHVLYFLKTKKIWGQTGQPPVAGPDFVPIFQEIKEDKDNFNADREGTIDVRNGQNTVTLNNTDHYWDYGSVFPFVAAGVDAAKVAADIDREIFIDCKRYHIVSIQPLNAPNSWTITIDRPYEGADADNLHWSTGALFVGAPWEFRIPTRLVWLREKGGCLPCYPIECVE